MKFLINFILLFKFFNLIESANILCLMGIASPSHHIWNRVLVKGIAAKGHNVTVLSPDIEKNLPTNVHYIHLETIYPTLLGGGIDFIEMANGNLIENTLELYHYCTVTCNATMLSKGLDNLLNYPKDFKFDLIIHDYTCGPCLLGFLHRFNHPPMISVSAFVNAPFSVNVIGGHNQMSYIPHYTLNFDKFMGFTQRFMNTVVYAMDLIYHSNVFIPNLDKMIKKKFGNDVPYAGDMEKETRLLFVNSNPVTEVAEPIQPNLIKVGGLQVEQPKPLPEDLKLFIENSKKGAVLFALGSNVRSDMLAEKTQLAIIEALGQMPQYNFIWKFESNLKVKIPKNILIKNWLPQSDILAHPKTVGFISHSGLLSSLEAQWYGVPIIAIPFFCDQHRNSYLMLQAGVAEILDFRTMTAEKIRNTVVKVLETPSYTEKMKIRSKFLQDQPMKPLELAVWWIEWILRNPNPEHLRSPTLDLNFITANNYDVLLFMIVVPVLLIHFFVKFVCCRSANKNEKSKNSSDKKNK